MHPSRRSHIIQSPPTPPSLPQSTSSSSLAVPMASMATSDAPAHHEKEHDTKSSSEASSSTSAPVRHPVSTTFALAPMTTTTVVTTTTTTSTEYPPLFFNPPPIPANLDPKIFPLADTPTPPALKKFCFDLNGQPTFFRENQENEQTMGQVRKTKIKAMRTQHHTTLHHASTQHHTLPPSTATYKIIHAYQLPKRPKKKALSYSFILCYAFVSFAASIRYPFLT